MVKVDTVAERHHREVTGLRAAHGAGAPVPEVLHAWREGRWYLVLAEIPTTRSLADGGSCWRQAGAAAARLHATPVPDELRMFCEGDGSDWVGHMLHRIQVESEAAAGRNLVTAGEARVIVRHARRVFAEAGPGRRALVHGDLQARHVLEHAGEVTLVDFGDAGWGDPVLDLVVLTHWTPERLGEVLDGYGADDGVRMRVGMLWTTYSLWRHLFVSRWYHENAFDRRRSADAARRVLEEQVLDRGYVLTAPGGPVEAVQVDCEVVLLDFDGLLVDTEFAGWRSWSELYSQYRSTLRIQDWAANTGSDDPLSPWERLDAVAGASVDRVTLEARRRVRRDTIMIVLPGVREFLARCRAEGLRLGLVSNSPQRWIDRQTDNLDLDQGLFDVVVPGEGHRAKPAPDGYLHALCLLGVEPERVLAVEDSARGVAAAQAAGLRCVAVPNRVTVHTDLSRADHVVSSLAHLRPIRVHARSASAR